MIVRNARFKQVLPGVVGYKGNLYTKAYAKGELLFDYTNDEYETQYLTIESLEDGNVITFTKPATITTDDLTSISYSTDGGLTWTTLTNDGSTAQSLSVSLDAGDKAIWKGTGTRTANADNSYSHFEGSKKWIAYGNIMSLLHGDNFYGQGTLTAERAFQGLFWATTYTSSFIDSHNIVLPTTKIENYCYVSMFRNNRAMTSTIKSLPLVAYRSFQHMFRDCHALVKAPELPGTEVKGYSYANMFQNCRALTEAPELPAMTLVNNCYNGMFMNCYALVKAPKLPATTLQDSCYRYMFQNCTSLVEAPELPATTLKNSCYQYMFDGCTSLNYIKCLATDISATNCTQYWVQNVAPTGDFVKDPSMNSWLIDNVNGIPIGWTLHGVATYTVTLTVNDSNMGVADGAGTYSAGDQVVIRADAFTGYSFVGWYDGSTLVSSDTTYVFNIYSNISYEARFAQSQQDEYLSKYFTIETLENNNRVFLQIPSNLTPQDMVRFDYSLDDGVTWVSTAIDNTAKNVIADLPRIGDKILFRGLGNRTSNNSTILSGCSFKCNKTYKVYGNIMSLLYGDNFTNQNTLSTNYSFEGLFDISTQNGTTYFTGSQKLVDAQNLRLPATTLSSYCYYRMFRNCDLMVKGPSSLPATNIASHCYEEMFMYCHALQECISSLPATTLHDWCYTYMFDSCWSLLQAPSISATIVAINSCSNMFEYCTSITTAPTLNATTLAQGCYSGMFAFCTSLTTPPSLPATSLARYCYGCMFDGCHSLTTAPSLPATNLPEDCYERMFGYCTSLLQAPDLVATTLGKNCYNKMFKDTNINIIKIYGVSSSYAINFGTLPSRGTYYTKPNATSNILNAKPDGWTISKTL